jgi:dTDP-4-amino-4,6-dideoxygalactose transaminase
MDRLSAATLAATWSEAAVATEARRANAVRLVSALQEIPGINLVTPIADGASGYLRLPALLSESRRARSEKSLGIVPGYPASLADLEGFGARRADSGALVQGARTLAGTLVTIPTHGWLRDEDFAALRSWAAGDG